MGKSIIGKKIGMTRVFDEDGNVIPVTACEVGPCVVVQKKTEEVDGYSALKLGFEDAKAKHLAKAQTADFEKKNVDLKRILKEVENFDDSLEVGSLVTCEIFTEGDVVSVSGVSKGKGFAGVVKRHGFGGGRMTHGSHFHRAPGSIGACAFPGEVWKGQKMPGRHGGKTVTVKNLKVVKILPEKNIVLISGAIPGSKNSTIIVEGK